MSVDMNEAAELQFWGDWFPKLV